MVNLVRKSSVDDQQDDDLKSLDFTPDPDAMKILQIKPPKSGEPLNGLDAEKIYRYQLEKDIRKLQENRGSFASKTLEYMESRYKDPKFMEIAGSTSKIGANCATEEVAQVTRELSWRATSRPAGVIAAKRFKEWLEGTPKGPSQQFIKDKEQRKMDSMLWENIKYDRLRKSKKQERLERKERAEAFARQKRDEADRIQRQKEALQMGEKLDSEANIKADVIKKQNLMNNLFEANRIVPTEGGQMRSMRDWDKGHHFHDELGNIERCFPVRQLTDYAVAGAEAVKFNDGSSYVDDAAVSTDKYIKAGDLGEWAYISHNIKINVARAELFLKDRAQMKRDYAKKLEREKRADEKRRLKAEQEAAARAARRAAGDESDSGSEYETDEGGEEGGEEKGDEGDGGDGDGVEGEAEGEKADGLQEMAELQSEVDNIERIENGDAADPVENPQNPNTVDDEPKKKKKKKKKKSCDDDATLSGSRDDTADDHGTTALKKAARIFKSAIKNSLTTGHALVKAKAKKGWSVLKLMVIYGRDYHLYLHRVGEDGAIAEEIKQEVPVVEPWEVPPGHELRLTRAERKRLEKLKRSILEERRLAWEAENSEEAIQARMFAEKAARDLKKKNFGRIWQDIVGYVTGTVPEYKKSTAQKLMEARAKQATIELKAEDNNAKAMDLLFAIREKQRNAEQWLRDTKDMVLGTNSALEEEFSADDLIREARTGNYNMVIDIMDHDMTPIGPNDVNQEGVSAFYTVLTLIMNNEGADVQSDLIDVPLWKKALRALRKKAASSKLDLVLRVLIHRGGNVNFLKQESDGDGLAIMHQAASAGSFEMINWLLSKKGDINILSNPLKRTPLMQACRADRLDVVMHLLKNGAMLAINNQDKNGWSALHFAACHGSSELAMVLLLCGASITVRTDRGLLPVEECMSRGRMEMMETLRTFKSTSRDFLSRIEFLSTHYPHPDQAKEEDHSLFDRSSVSSMA